MRPEIKIGVTLAFIASAAAAQSPEREEILNYELTMQKVIRYDAAARALEAATNNDPEIRAERQKMIGEFATTMGALKLSLDRHPRILAFYTKEKLTRDDAALIPRVLSNGCRAADLPQFARELIYSEAQVDFCKVNRMALRKLRLFQPVRPIPKRSSQ